MKKFLISLGVFILLASAAAGVGYSWFQKNSKVYPGSISISEGTAARQVADILEANGVIDNSSVFYYYIRAKQAFYDLAPWIDEPFEVSFKAGTFNLDVKDFDSLIEALNDYDNTTSSVASEGLVTFPEGSTIRDMSLILEEQGIVNAQAFLELTNDKEYYEELRKKYNWLPEYKEGKINLLEGYLHPNSYAFEPNTLPHKIIETLLSETNKWYEENKVAILSSNYTFDELVTLASVVEKESKFSEDRPKVAQVFFNRLRLGMKLESDITAAYANQEHKVFMTYDDIATDSPYNTYKTSGIPIGPINAPSIESLNATLKPSGEQFTAIYFYARPDGTTFYANTFEEHEQNRLKYEHEWLELSKQEQQNKNN